MMKKALFLVQALLLAPSLVDGTLFSYNDDFSCSSPVSLYVDSMSCGDSSVCNFGDSVEASGSLTLSSDLPDETCITAKACFLNMVCRSFDMQNVDVCDRLNMQSADGNSDCPSAGSYSFSLDQNVGSARDLSLGSGWWVTIRIEATDCDSGETFTKCKGSFKAISTYSDYKGMVSFSALGAAALALGLLIRRRRRAARIDLRAEEELAAAGGATGRFEMMRDVGVRA